MPPDAQAKGLRRPPPAPRARQARTGHRGSTPPGSRPKSPCRIFRSSYAWPTSSPNTYSNNRFAGVGRRPGLAGRAARLLGRGVRLAGGRAETEQLRPLPGPNRRARGAFRAWADTPRRPGIPLILGHGWPSGSAELLPLVPLLTDPGAGQCSIPGMSRPPRASSRGHFERRDLLLDATLTSQQEMPPSVDRHQLRSPDPSSGLGGIVEC